MENHIMIPVEQQPQPEIRLLGDQQGASGGDESLDFAIQRLETFFRRWGFYQDPAARFLFSWTLFFLLGVSAPLFVFLSFNCSAVASGGAASWSPIREFDVCVMTSQASLAAFSLICVSRNLRKHGMRKLLFTGKPFRGLDRLHRQQAAKITGFFRTLFFWVGLGVVTKTIREVTRIYYAHHGPWWRSLATLMASVLSWTYLTVIFLSGGNLFSLVCNLQVIHFEDYGQLLQNHTEVSVLLEEHTSLCHRVSKISHRFRVQLLLIFFISVISQFVTLLLTTQYHTIVDFINAGDFAVCAAVQVIGIVICLSAATRISHRAQRLASLASRWHALATCRSAGSTENFRLGAPVVNQCSVDHDHPVEAMLSSAITAREKGKIGSISCSLYQRQALVMYLQSNNGGITIYGWAVDRGLINTIFCIELSLLLFVFGRTL
ncbi:unnamed protein product [Spirodela intermedia]|uniref:Uncharacterized protein n=1 Tax=Spirodela intermedia TaxID=51605 RepID=A0A7I8KFC2_SPIIN|nr:unnamed protein product [Spirodela intermedia]